MAVSDRVLSSRPPLTALSAELKVINETIWQSEEELRTCERSGDFGARFVELARSVYRDNDHRAALKRAIDDRIASSLFEVKYHQSQ